MLLTVGGCYCRSSVSVCADTHCSVSISVERLSRYTLLWDGCISLFFCIIISCIISCSDLNNGNVDCADGYNGDDSFIESSSDVQLFTCKIIRFEELKRQIEPERVKEGNSKCCKVNFIINLHNIE